ncbi:cyd operon YbgE family protein [Pseudomonas lopnurensis]|uniref:cyd operon YbgE family protein n=1 Tax=Pseudomonas lopnurensis TaxID=1477517 RepID=UPI0018790F3F|nr:cyd operon YbgE family protein [Pseudomonas lopnurensis]MBE7375117.1 cyd operon YbgE family protein [Pseudomonas lopnurensis]
MIGTATAWLYRPASRVLSLLLATPLALVLLIHPAAMLDSRGGYSHPLLMLVMWGVSAGFVHGVGFVPRLWLWGWLLGPLPAWTFAMLGYLILFDARLG